MPEFIEQFGELDASGTKVLTSNRQSIITSTLSAGTFIGSLAQSWTSDKFGRRGSILIWGIIFTIGVIVQTSAFSYGQLAAGRSIAGLGVGAMSGELSYIALVEPD